MMERKRIRAINKRTDEETDFTLEQWENLERTGHTDNWKVVDDSALVDDNVEMVVDFEFSRWEQKLNDSGIKYDKRIKDPEKLKAIFEEAMKEPEEVVKEEIDEEFPTEEPDNKEAE